jgi:hypothetical protein
MRVRNADSKQSLHGGGSTLACSGLEQNQQLAVWHCGGAVEVAADCRGRGIHARLQPGSKPVVEVQGVAAKQ